MYSNIFQMFVVILIRIMKALIIYYTKSGHSKDYAETISSRVDGTLINIKDVKKNHISEHDVIVFVSSVYGNKINKIEKYLKWYNKFENKDWIICRVGMSPASQDARELEIITNGLDDYHIRYYQLTGGFDIKKVPFPYNLIMKIGLKRASASGDFGEAAKANAENILKYPMNYNDLAGIEKVVSVIRKLMGR